MQFVRAPRTALPGTPPTLARVPARSGRWAWKCCNSARTGAQRETLGSRFMGCKL